MYIEKDIKTGYNVFTELDKNDGEKSLMEVALLVMEPGDTFEFQENDKEVSWVLMKGKATVEVDGKVTEIERPDPFDYVGACLLMSKGSICKIEAVDYSEFYVQKTYNDREFEPHIYSAEDTHTWARGTGNELDGMMRRDVRTYYDYESRPDSNMVLGEVVNQAGKWSSYPPHSHPQPEVYFYFFEDERGFGAGWADGKPHELHHHGCLVITDEYTHSQVMAPGYPCCYIWGIRHLDGNPWEKTRIDDPDHEWLLEENPDYWRPKED